MSADKRNFADPERRERVLSVVERQKKIDRLANELFALDNMFRAMKLHPSFKLSVVIRDNAGGKGLSCYDIGKGGPAEAQLINMMTARTKDIEEEIIANA